MKIAMFEMEEWEERGLKELSDQHQVETINEKLTEKNVDRFADFDIISTFIYSKVDRTVLERCKNLKLIATRSTGFDHIDTEYCQEKGISVCNVPTYGENTVAEHVFALLLAISRKIWDSVCRTQRGDFRNEGLLGFDLKDKTLGVVGTGNIGLHAIRIARGFEMKVLAFDVRPREDLARDLGFRYVDLPELLAASDVVSLHVPENPKTHHLLAEEQFHQMKDGAIVINTSRGGVIDNRALLQALIDGKVAAAGLDVLPEEPAIREEAELPRKIFSSQHDLEKLLTDHLLLRRSNVVITPHNAFNTREALQRILDTTRDNIEAFLRGEPRNMVS
ncbi:MAG: hydroxyacid dehydrogenase [Syntrophotaleaceae bacterium]